MCYSESMSFQGNGPKIGYTRYEFGQIFQIYSRNVYTGLFKDFSFSEYQGQYFISFREEAGKTPLITIQKRRLGPDKALFIATTPGPSGQLKEIARSEKIGHFVEKLREEVDALKEARMPSPKNIRVVS